MRIARVAGSGGSELALVDPANGKWRRTGISGDGEWLDGGLPAFGSLAEAEPIDPASLLPPVTPRTIVGVGLNYRAHAAEQGRALPGEPRLFLKNTRSLAPPSGALPLHPASSQLDYEAELGIVIGAAIFNCSRTEAAAAIAGWVVVQDFSLRDLVRPETLPLAKGGPAMAPLGPWLTSVEAVPVEGFGDLVLRCRVNGELRQEASCADMQFGPVDLVHYTARFMPLGPGDVIATGSPGGSGVGLSPPRWLQPGDVIETEISVLGKLRQEVTKAV
jgi:2-keto-4-pentenoate hydratase/2-oxohepta-3-ene-1,7-dioic acid hydratase in catechol pathway